MGILGDTLGKWINERAAEWKGRLAGWLIDSTVKGAEAIAAQIEPQALELVKGQIDILRNMEGMPPEYKDILDSLTVPKNPAILAALIFMLKAVAESMANTLVKQSLEPVMQQLAKLTPFNVPDLGVTLDMKLRGKLKPTEYEDLVGRAGWSKDWADRFLELKTPVFPSEIALNAWRRDPGKYGYLLAELPKLGLTTAQIEALTELSWRVPGVQDIIRYVVKEAYDPATVAEFGQASEYPTIAEADAAIVHGDLTALLYLQGYNRDEFEA